jgi:hypothetical protein
MCSVKSLTSSVRDSIKGLQHRWHLYDGNFYSGNFASLIITGDRTPILKSVVNCHLHHGYQRTVVGKDYCTGLATA